MTELWGADSCPSCRQALTLLQRAHIEFRYVDVAKIAFEGEIPRVILGNGTQIIGLGPINNYIKQQLREMI